MAPGFSKVYLIVAATATVIGLLASVFIVAFYCLEKAKGRRLNTCDIILVALGVSFMFCQCTLLGNSCAYVMKAVDPHILLQFTVWSGSCSCWLTAWLSVFYCLKIVDFNNHLFFWLKQRMSKLVPWLILGTVIGSLILSIPLNWTSGREYPQNSTVNLKANATLTGEGETLEISYLYTAVAFGISLPLLLGIASITVILTSLGRHTWRMKKKSSSFSQPRLDAHFGAVRMLGSLLCICVLFVLSDCLMPVFRGHWLWTIFQMGDVILFPAQPIVLILGIPKLRQALIRIINPWRK